MEEVVEEVAAGSAAVAYKQGPDLASSVQLQIHQKGTHHLYQPG